MNVRPRSLLGQTSNLLLKKKKIIFSSIPLHNPFPDFVSQIVVANGHIRWLHIKLPHLIIQNNVHYTRTYDFSKHWLCKIKYTQNWGSIRLNLELIELELSRSQVQISKKRRNKINHRPSKACILNEPNTRVNVKRVLAREEQLVQRTTLFAPIHLTSRGWI